MQQSKCNVLKTGKILFLSTFYSLVLIIFSITQISSEIFSFKYIHTNFHSHFWVLLFCRYVVIASEVSVASRYKHFIPSIGSYRPFEFLNKHFLHHIILKHKSITNQSSWDLDIKVILPEIFSREKSFNFIKSHFSHLTWSKVGWVSSCRLLLWKH